ncbi:MAG: hypothetical protein ACK4VI_09810 [Alphaproteobacteria bacterium]
MGESPATSVPSGMSGKGCQYVAYSGTWPLYFTTAVQSSVPFVMRLNIRLSKVLIGFHLTLIIFFLSVFAASQPLPPPKKSRPWGKQKVTAQITAVDGDFVKLIILRSSITENIIGSELKPHKVGTIITKSAKPSCVENQSGCYGRKRT